MDDKERIAFLERSLKWFIDNVGLIIFDDRMYFYDSGCGCCADSVHLPDELAAFVFAARGSDGKGPRNGV